MKHLGLGIGRVMHDLLLITLDRRRAAGQKAHRKRHALVPYLLAPQSLKDIEK